MIGFVMTRKVVCDTTNKYWNESYRTIRRFYPDAIVMIVDDGSDYEFVRLEEDQKLYNVFIVRSKFEGAGEMLAYYYFYKYKLFDKAVIMHDSVFFQKYIDFDKEGDIRFLWHFMRHSCDDVQTETMLLHTMEHSENLIEFYRQKNLWQGCFGSQSVVSHDFLTKLEDTYRIFRILPLINDRKMRYAIERITGCIFTYEHRQLKDKPSMFGSIYAWMNWGYPFEKYENNGRKHHKPIVKVWTSR